MLASPLSPLLPFRTLSPDLLCTAVMSQLDTTSSFECYARRLCYSWILGTDTESLTRKHLWHHAESWGFCCWSWAPNTHFNRKHSCAYMAGTHMVRVSQMIRAFQVLCPAMPFLCIPRVYGRECKWECVIKDKGSIAEKGESVRLWCPRP